MNNLEIQAIIWLIMTTGFCVVIDKNKEAVMGRYIFMSLFFMVLVHYGFIK